AEETIFRGMLFPALSKLFKSPVWGGLAQAFMFASIHPQGPAAWVSLMAIGAVCAAVTYRAGAQWPSMLLHGLHNGILLLLNIALT
ncbi:CPBP family intramembrane glutamic endopeptidase, partial [Acinetobacter baumannii]